MHLLLYERFNNVHHGFMKASKTYISFLWVVQKCASCFMKVIKFRISFLCAMRQCASRFYEGLKHVHLLFMNLSKSCITIYEGHKKQSPLHESLKNWHWVLSQQVGGLYWTGLSLRGNWKFIYRIIWCAATYILAHLYGRILIFVHTYIRAYLYPCITVCPTPQFWHPSARKPKVLRVLIYR